MSEKKTEKGGRFNHYSDAIEWLLADRWVYRGNKPYHPDWAWGWPLGTFIAQVRKGSIRKCLGLTGEPYTSPPKEYPGGV